MLHRLCFVMAVISGLSIAGDGMAQPPRNPPPTRPAPASANPASSAAASSPRSVPIPGLLPLSMMSVQREIGLTAEQKQQLKAVSEAYVASEQQLSKTFNELATEEKQKQGKDFNDRAMQVVRDAQSKAEAILTPPQLQTVKKIAFELAVTGVLANPAAQEKIGLSAEQRQRLSQIFEQSNEKLQQLQRDTAQQTMQVLNEEQTASLKQQLEAQKKPQ